MLPSCRSKGTALSSVLSFLASRSAGHGSAVEVLDYFGPAYIDSLGSLPSLTAPQQLLSLTKFSPLFSQVARQYSSQPAYKSSEDTRALSKKKASRTSSWRGSSKEASAQKATLQPSALKAPRRSIGQNEGQNSLQGRRLEQKASAASAIGATKERVSSSQADKQEEQSLTYKGLKAQAARNRKADAPYSPPDDRLRMIQALLQRFEDSSRMKDQALALYVSAKAFPRLAGSFRKFMLGSMTKELDDALGICASRSKRLDVLFRLFAEYVVDRHSNELQEYREAVTTMDLRKPYLWYPVARAIQRRFIYHAGPTNSGKTFTALEAMKQASSGLYCGPLRLLAMEVYDELNAGGTFCNLITGQERRILPGATHTACTIEMTSTQKRVDVAVIDEIQLLGDDSRGWAWTRAVQGLAANEIHLCGDGSAIPLVRWLTEAMGEKLEVQQYERFTPVQVEDGGLREGFKSVQPGDCVVAFSRKSIYEVKTMIESATGIRTCVVYGALPPETRRQQAKLFNEEGNEFSVMVASDAVGMGLNLNIRRIIFTTLKKFEGTFKKQISVSEIKQISGRAGRRNSQFPVGYVTCLEGDDMQPLKEALDVPISQLATPAAGLFPEFEHLEAYASKSLQANFLDVLKHFAQEARLEGRYFFCRQEGLEMAAKLLLKVEGLSLQEKYWFCLVPLNLREPRHASALLHFATRFAARQPVNLEVHVPQSEPQTPDDLHRMELLHQIVSAWLWLSNRFEQEMFPGKEAAEKLSQQLIDRMHESLQHMFAPGKGKRQSQGKRLSDLIQDMKQPYLKNLSWDAQQHLNEASDNRIRSLLLQRSQAARKTQGGPVFPGGTSGSSSNRAQLTFAQPA